MKKKILIIGANGLIGRSFIELYKNNYKIISGLNGDPIKNLLKRTKPNIIINSSGELNHQDKMFATNTLIVKDILDYCIENRNVSFIHFGSSSEYGRRNFHTDEHTSLLPTTVYEGTKAAASMLVQGYAKAFNLKAIIVRPYCVFGYFSKQNLLIPLIINTILENKSLNIYRGFHDYIYVKDFVRGINILIKNYKKWSSGEIINLGSGKQISNFRVFRVIRKHFGLSGNFSLINKHFKSYDSDMWVGNIQHAYKKYNFRTEYSFEEAVKDIKKYYNFS